jgi:WD40 repeat protein
MTNVFISYSRKDKEAARRLTEAFKAQDLDFWIDWEGIEPTVDWWREIEKGIEGADNFLFLISPDSASSRVCRQEVEHAVKNGKRLIPVVVRDIKAEEAPEPLRPLNWIFLRETAPADDFETAFGKLLTAIRTDYEWVEFHRRLQVKALEWERGKHENSLLVRGKDLQAAESELSVNSAKEPRPTALQLEYVLKSRQASDRQRRWLVGVSLGAAIVMAGLAVFGFRQAKLATDRANLALSRQLAAQSQTIYATGNSKEMTSVLLAIQSMKSVPSVDAAQILQTNTLIPPIARMSHGQAVYSVAFSPDGRYVVSGGCDQTDSSDACLQGSARVWEAATGKEITRVTYEGPVDSVAFSPDGKTVVSAGCDQKGTFYECSQASVRIWEAGTGKEMARMKHDSAVQSVLFSPECLRPPEASAERCGRYVLAREEVTARLWEVGRSSPEYEASFIAFSPDGKYLLSVERQNDLAKVSEMPTGKIIAQMTLSDYVHSAAFSPDDAYLVVGGCETPGADHCIQGSTRVWNITTGKEMAHFLFDNDVISVAFSPGGRYVVAGSLDKTARVLETETGKEVARMTHDGYVSSVGFSPEGSNVISASEDGTARVWEALTGKEIARITHDGIVTSVAFSPNGRQVVSGSEDGTTRVWELSPGKDVAYLPYHGNVSSVTFSPDSQYMASSGCQAMTQDPSDGTLRCTKGAVQVWKAATRQEIARMSYAGGVDAVVFSPDSQYLLSVGCDEQGGSCSGRMARVWEVRTGKEIAHMSVDSYLVPIAFSVDSKYVVSGGIVWEAMTGKVISRSTDPVSSLALSPDGKYVISGRLGDSDYMYDAARVWELMTGKEIARVTFREFGDSVPVAFGPDGKFVVSGGCDKTEIHLGVVCVRGTTRVWEALTGKEIARMTSGGNIASVAFSPECVSPPGASAERCGKVVASAGCDKTDSGSDCILGSARVWEAQTGQEIARMTYDGMVNSIAFSPDGKYVISGGCDKEELNHTCTEGSARVWESTTGKEIARTTYDGFVNSVAFSPDGKYVVSAGCEKPGLYNDCLQGSARVWLWQPADLIAGACAYLPRNLTLAEWNQYLPNQAYQKTCEQLPRDSSYYRSIAEEVLSNSNGPRRIQTALESVKAEMESDAAVENPAVASASIVESSVLAKIVEAIDNDQPTAALDLLQQAKAQDLQLVAFLNDARRLSALCWHGSTQGSAAQVLSYCDRAVALAPEDGDIRDSRGLARALTGDYEGAIADFQAFLNTLIIDDQLIRQRQEWIVELQAGKNPFTQDVLDHLKNQ